MALPITKTDSKDLAIVQTTWSSQLNPILANLLFGGTLLKEISLIAGSSTFNHYLNKQMLGWFIVDKTAAATINRSAPLNSQTLTLTSNLACTISLWVF